MNPSHTGYALIANRFIAAMAASGLRMNAYATNYLTVWGTDPYRDTDGDGFVTGPDDRSEIEDYEKLIDCDDGEKDVIAPQFSGEACLSIDPG